MSDSPQTALLLGAGLGLVAVAASESISSDLAAAPGGHSWYSLSITALPEPLILIHESIKTHNVSVVNTLRTPFSSSLDSLFLWWWTSSSFFLSCLLEWSDSCQPQSENSRGGAKSEDGAVGGILSRQAPSRAANQAAVAAASASLCSFKITSSPLLQGLHIDHSNPPKRSYYHSS